MLKKLFVIIFILYGVESAFAIDNYETIHKLIPHIDKSSNNVEFYILKPKISKKLPVVIYIHGFQKGERIGAKEIIDNGTLISFVNQGYIAVGISQPGFGNSNGSADFSGPYTQRAILSVIKYLKSSRLNIDSKKIALGGISRGAITASAMVATQNINLAGLILDAGAYDLQSITYPATIANIEREVGSKLSNKEAKQRSALYFAHNIKMPVILFHGAKDPRHPVSQVLKFYDTLIQENKRVTLAIFPTEHKTPREDVSLMTKSFLRDLFLSN